MESMLNRAQQILFNQIAVGVGRYTFHVPSLKSERVGADA
jgi:hypothetical protein